MTNSDTTHGGLRAGLIASHRATRDAERAIFDAFDPADRDAPAADGGWSAKDIQAHLSAWKRHQTERLTAIREGRDEPAATAETDEQNAIFHAERADWPWADVRADAEQVTMDLIAAIEAATDETLEQPRVSGSILGNGPEHGLAHLPPVAARVGMEARVTALADALEASLNDGWPSRATAFARYNLACFYAPRGHLDEARRLLRQALPAQEELRSFAPTDDDLIALRDEIETLSAG
jgi:DinB superfamily